MSAHAAPGILAGVGQPGRLVFYLLDEEEHAVAGADDIVYCAGRYGDDVQPLGGLTLDQLGQLLRNESLQVVGRRGIAKLVRGAINGVQPDQKVVAEIPELAAEIGTGHVQFLANLLLDGVVERLAAAQGNVGVPPDRVAVKPDTIPA